MDDFYDAIGRFRLLVLLLSPLLLMLASGGGYSLPIVPSVSACLFTSQVLCYETRTSLSGHPLAA